MPDTSEGQHLLRQVRFLAIVLFVLLLASTIQLQFRNHDIDRMRDAVTETKQAAAQARDAAHKASVDLTAAIEASKQPQDPKGPIPTALREIHTILVELRRLDAAMRGSPP